MTCRCTWSSDVVSVLGGQAGLRGTPRLNNSRKKHGLWLAYYAWISGLMVSQWLSDLSGSQAVSLGSDGLVGKGPFVVHSTCFQGFQRQLYLETG